MTKCYEIFLFFGSQFLIIFYVTFEQMEEIKNNEKNDKMLDQPHHINLNINEYDDDSDDSDLIHQNHNEHIAFVL